MCFSKVRMNPLLRNCVASNLSKHVWINMTAYSRNLKRKKVSNFPLLFLRRINCLSINTIYHFCTLLKQHESISMLYASKPSDASLITSAKLVSFPCQAQMQFSVPKLFSLSKKGLPCAREYFAIRTM